MNGPRTLVVCPGRGTYGKAELGYLASRHSDKLELLGSFDEIRKARGQISIGELDRAKSFSTRTQGAGENAAALIFASAFFDFQSIEDREVVAIVGNSMGWYIALACAGALMPTQGFHLANEMGTLMNETALGAQLVYSLVDEEWREVPGRREEVMRLVASLDKEPDHRLFQSIDLGGMLVLAGDEIAISALAKPCRLSATVFLSCCRATPPFTRLCKCLSRGRVRAHSNPYKPINPVSHLSMAVARFGRPIVPIRKHCGPIHSAIKSFAATISQGRCMWR